MEYNEDSEEYESLCNRYESIIGFSRSENKEKFDKAILNLLSVDVSNRMKDKISNIVRTYELSLTDKGFRGWIEFGGYILNPLDFGAIKVTAFRTHIFKQ